MRVTSMKVQILLEVTVCSLTHTSAHCYLSFDGTDMCRLSSIVLGLVAGEEMMRLQSELRAADYE